MIIDYLCVGAHVIAGRDFLYTSVFGDPSDITLGATYFIFIDSLLLLYHVIFEKYLIKTVKLFTNHKQNNVSIICSSCFDLASQTVLLLYNHI